MSSSWIEKYRPKQLKNIIGQSNIIYTLKQLTDKDTTIPNLLFYGMPGTGKTTTIISLCYELFGPINYNERVLELNASDDRGIDVIRKSVLSFAKKSLSPSDPNYPSPNIKFIILDEADAMTMDAQSALRKIMDTYKNTRFCIICNYIEKIIKPLISRCMFFNFKPIKSSYIIKHLTLISKNEGLDITTKQIENIYNSYNGDLRQAINILQQLKYYDKTDLDTEIYEMFDESFYEDIYDKMKSMNKTQKIKYFEDQGYDKLKYRDYLIKKFNDKFDIVKSLLKYCNVFDY